MVQGREGDKRRLKRQPRFPEQFSHSKEISASVAFLQLFKNEIVKRLNRAHNEQTTRITQFDDEFRVLEQMFDLDGHIVSELWKFIVQCLDQRNRVADAIEKIRVAKRDVFRTSSDLLPHVVEDDFPLNNSKDTVINGNDGAMAAEMFASAAGFRIPDGAVLARGQDEMGVRTKCWEIASIWRQETKPGERNI